MANNNSMDDVELPQDYKEDDIETESGRVSPSNDQTRRTRSRSRTDSYLRKQKQRMMEIDKSNSKALLICNLKNGCHEAVEQRVVQLVGKHNITSVSLFPVFTFGFLEFATKETMLDAAAVLEKTSINGFSISVERCLLPTPGRNPRAAELGPPTEVIVIKNLPYSTTRELLAQELNSVLPSTHVYEITLRYTTSGNFSGMGFVRFLDVEQSEFACHALNAIDILGRKTRVEYKRAENRGRTNKIYEPADEECKALFEDLKAWTEGSEVSRTYPSELTAVIRKQVHAMADALNLRHACEGDGTVCYIRVWKPTESELARSRSVSLTRTSLVNLLIASSEPAADSRHRSLSMSTTNLAVIRPPIVVPIRQPRGPDETRGFSTPRSGHSRSLAGSQKSLSSADSGFGDERRQQRSSPCPDGPYGGRSSSVGSKIQVRKNGEFDRSSSLSLQRGQFKRLTRPS